MRSSRTDPPASRPPDIHVRPLASLLPTTPRAAARRRPPVLTGCTRALDTQFGDVFVTVNIGPDGRPFEVFVRLDKAGSRAMADAEAIARLISLALRWDVPPGEVHRQLRGISCEEAATTARRGVLSVPDAVAQAMEGLVPAAPVQSRKEV